MVLVRCEPNSLKFMNSWGTDWGDDGFFKISDTNVLNGVIFYDVFWTLDDLFPSEKEAYDAHQARIVASYAANFKSLHRLSYQCPRCQDDHPLNDYSGSLFEAICPSCRNAFKPVAGGLTQSLYARSLRKP